MRTLQTLALAALLAGAPLLHAGSAQAAGEITCRMSFSLSGWSVFYKTASGSGEVTCSNGEHMHVRLESKGGGLTFGKSSIAGEGRFSGIYDIREILGSYANAQAQGVVMTKGNVSLALSGKGRGWDLGVDFGKFTISAR